MVYTIGNLTIYMGDSATALYPERDRVRWQQSADLLQEPSFTFLKYIDRVTHLFLPHQVHGVAGVEITQNEVDTFRSFTTEVDFLYTNTPGFGLGVLTADCVPLTLYDPVKQSCAMVHVGWRGAVKGVVVKAIDALQTDYSSKPADLKVILGPSARSCCYVVDHTFVLQSQNVPYFTTAVQQKGEALFFDIPTFIEKQCIAAGISPLNINLDYCLCTICSLQFCSFRRQKNEAGRQLSMAFFSNML